MKKNKNFLNVLENYINVHLPNHYGASKHTIKAYKLTLKMFVIYICSHYNISARQVKFNKLTQSVIIDFLDHLETKRKCSISTRNSRLAALKSFAKYAENEMSDAMFFRNNTLRVTIKKTLKKDMNFFTHEEVSILLDLYRGSNKMIDIRNRAILYFMYATGARVQEVCDVKLKDVKKRGNEISVILHGKNNKAREVPIASSFSLVILEFIKLTNIKADDFLFSSIQKKHMTTSCISEIFKKSIKIAKEQHPTLFQLHYTPHTMRHTTATHMFQAKISIIVIQKILGHANIETTTVYTHITQNTINEHVSKWYHLKETHVSEMMKSTEEECYELPDFLK